MKIVLEELTYGEIEVILERYEVLVQVMTASNNTLLAKLAACPECGPAARGILNDWSVFTNQLHALHLTEMETACARGQSLTAN